MLRKITKGLNCYAKPMPIHPDVREMLLSLSRYDIGENKSYVFLCHGKPYGPNRLNVVWKDVCGELGVNGVNLYRGTPHSLVSQAEIRGISEAIIGKMLRHNDPKSTKQYAYYRTSTLRMIW